MVHRGKDAPPGLDIDLDLDWQRRAWFVERVGQWAIFALVVAALLGAFGSGLIGDARRASSDGSLVLEYPRIAHAKAPLSVRIVVPPPPDLARRDLEVWISGELFAAHDLEQVVPEPDSVAFADGGLTFRFPREPSTTPEPATVALRFEGRRAGRVVARVAVPGHASVELRQFVYP